MRDLSMISVSRLSPIR